MTRTATPILALALALSACESTADEPLPPQPAGPVVYGTFPPIWQRLQVEPDATLSELLRAWSTLVDLAFTADEPTRARLASTPVGLLGSTSIPAADVYSWVGGLLLRHGLVMADLTGTDPRLVGIYPVEELANAPATEVAPELLGDYERLPALVIQTTLQLGSSDVRTLSNTMRGVASEAVVVVPVGNTNNVVLRGTARQVIDTALTLQRLDAKARQVAGGG